VETGDAVDVVLLAPGLDDPVRVAQRLHSLDRDGAVIVLAAGGTAPEVRHALTVAPFLGGDVTTATDEDAAALAQALAAAAARTRARREDAGRAERSETPPPLSARYIGTLLDSVPIGLVTLDDGGAVIGWNKRTGEMLGVSEVEALGREFATLFDDDDRPRLDALIESLGSAGIDEEGQVFERGERAFELTGARFAIRSGESGTLLILQDVTKRHRAERELQLQQALMAAQADSSLVGIAVVTLDGSLQRINRRWSEIWRLDRDPKHGDRELGLRTMLDQVVDPEAFVAGISQLTRRGEGEFRDEVELKDGRAIERYATHVRDADGRVIGRIWFHTDISAHRHQEDSLRFLSDATNLLSSSLDYQTTLRRVADLAVSKIADWCAVEIVNLGTHQNEYAVAHADPAKLDFAREFRERYPQDPETGAVAVAIRTGESQVYPVIPQDALLQAAKDEGHLRMLQELRLQSAMIVPIKIRERVFGAISFISSDSARAYGDEDVVLAEELARRAAIAIDNSRVHAELRETARTLQESLLPPHLPAVRGLELAARFRPAGFGMQVGGDFYDIFDTSSNKWGMAVGDVCGKGAEAAALTALTRYTVRAAAMYEQDPSGVLRVLNEALLRQRGDLRFTTLAFCIIDLQASPRTLRVSCGGHPRPLLLRPDGTTEAVGAGGPLLGVIPDAEFADQQVELEEGDVIVLYTDGVTDALAPEQMIDEGDLLAALADCRGLSAGEVSHRLEQVALAGDPSRVPRDDIAIVVAKLG
jgi:PAS domain S-box-containing protein